MRIAIAESLASWEFHSRFKDFHEKYPGIRLKIIATSTDEMFQMLGQNQVDIVYTLDRRIFNHNYVTAFEAPVDIHFVTGAGHPLAACTDSNHIGTASGISADPDREKHELPGCS